jgi:dTDP-4-amino-4,6-dideoxygalactose transaminase
MPILFCWLNVFFTSLQVNFLFVKSIPFLNLSFQHQAVAGRIQDAITRISGKNWFILGKEVEDFEKAWAAYSGTPFCAGVGNGLDALSFCLMALGVGPGDEVIIPANTYIATWLSVSRTGATIVPVEPDQSTFNIDVNKVGERISPRTRVILPVHLFGQACDMTTLDVLARRHKLFVVEDNAQAHGARWLEKITGSFGDVNATSFYPTKNLGAWGDGGAVTSFNEKHDLHVRMQRNYGSIEKNVHLQQGSNSRLDEIQAGILKAKLAYLDEWNEMRRAIATQYLDNLSGIGDLILPLSAKEAYHVYHQFVIRTHSREKLKAYLQQHEIDTMIHYPVPPFMQPAYSAAEFRSEDFPVSILMASTSLSLPIWPGMSNDDVSYVSETIREFFR